MKKIVIASSTPYITKEFAIKKTKKKFIFINQKTKLSLKKLKKINPKIIFFPQWSWIVNKQIIKKFNCVGFHSTPLPFGRGGTPIQNMISRGFTKSKVCAFQLTEKLDEGPIYLKQNVSLKGRGEEIMIRIHSIIAKMIIKLSKKIPKPKKQMGKPLYFKRRKETMSEIPKNLNFKKLYNHIRMLDLDTKNFPKAFIKFSNYKIIFEKVKYSKNEILCNVKIKR